MAFVMAALTPAQYEQIHRDHHGVIARACVPQARWQPAWQRRQWAVDAERGIALMRLATLAPPDTLHRYLVTCGEWALVLEMAGDEVAPIDWPEALKPRQAEIERAVAEAFEVHGLYGLAPPQPFDVPRPRFQAGATPFVFERLTPAQCEPLMARVQGPIFQFQPMQVVDRARGVTLLDLGGQGDRPAERAECPTFYNLFWGEHVVAFRGHDQIAQDDRGLSVVLTLVGLTLPAGLPATAEEVRAVIQQAVAACWQGRFGRPFSARVVFDGSHESGGPA
ncbi:MAG: hypothetical protein RI907_2162 [Pseudomonadota bacterium]|jgi:hypothetical protein